jgi:hypothetical protein
MTGLQEKQFWLGVAIRRLNKKNQFTTQGFDRPKMHFFSFTEDSSMDVRDEDAQSPFGEIF